MYYLSTENTSLALKMDWISHAFAITSTSLGKVAFALFLLRIIPVGKKKERYFLHGFNILLVLIQIPLIIITYVQCNPVAGLWEPDIGAKCWNPQTQASYAVFQGCGCTSYRTYQSLANVVTAYGTAADFVLALFPILIIWKLQVDKKTKFGLVGLMCLGVLCVSPFHSFHR